VGSICVNFVIAGYVPLISENRCPIGVYFVASYRPDLSQSVLFAVPTWSALFMLLLFNGDSLLPIVLALFWTLFCFASTFFFYILSQKALLAFFFLFSTDYLYNFELNSTI